jgi:uncharacterized protein
MKYFAAIQSIRDLEKMEATKKEHVEFLEQMATAGKIALRGRFIDGTGGLTIFKAETLEEAQRMAEDDPYVRSGARKLELHEWNMTPKFDEQ